MLKRAFIISVEEDKHGGLQTSGQVVDMAQILVRSLRTFGGKHKDMDVYIGCFSPFTLDQKDKDFFEKEGCFYEESDCYSSIVGQTKKAGLNISRQLVCHYFGNKLLGKYDELIYLDVDIVILNEPSFPEIIPDGILTDIIPQQYAYWEEAHVDSKQIEKSISEAIEEPVQRTLSHAPWITNVNRKNLHIHNEVLEVMKRCPSLFDNTHSGWGVIVFSWILEKRRVQTISPLDYSGMVPYEHRVTRGSAIVHYDSFDANGYFYQILNFGRTEVTSFFKDIFDEVDISFDIRFTAQIKRVIGEEKRLWLKKRTSKTIPRWIRDDYLGPNRIPEPMLGCE